MMKRIFKISLIVTVVSLLITLVLLPFGVRSMLDTANKWAEYTTYEVEYEQPAEGITQVNDEVYRILGVDELRRGAAELRVRISPSPPAACSSMTSPPLRKSDGTVMNLTVDFQVKPEFEQLASLARVSNMIQTNLKVPLGVAVSFDESSCQIFQLCIPGRSALGYERFPRLCPGAADLEQHHPGSTLPVCCGCLYPCGIRFRL